MKKLLVLIAFCMYGIAFSQSNTIEGFVPKGCKILAVAKGDLNNDKQEDVAIVIQEPDVSRDPKKAEQYDEDLIALHPQALLILFKKGGGYEQKVYNRVFIPSKNKKESPDEKDYFLANGENFYIKKGVLQCTFNYYSNVSSWSNSEETYSFCLKGNDMVLTRYHCSTIHNSDGVTLEKKIDFDKSTVTFYERVTDYVKDTVRDTKPPITLKLKDKKPVLLKNMINAIGDNYNVDYENK